MGHGFSGVGNLTIDFVAEKKEYFLTKNNTRMKSSNKYQSPRKTYEAALRS